MSFDHIRIPKTFYRDQHLLTSPEVRAYLVLAHHYSFTSLVSYPSVETIASAVRAKTRWTQMCLRGLEREFFVVTDTYASLKAAGLLDGVELYIPDKRVFVLPDFLFLETKDQDRRFKLLRYAIGQGRTLLHPGAHATAPRGAPGRAKVGRTLVHLNYMLELYDEQERLLMEKATRPGSKTTLIVERAIEHQPPILGETPAERALQAQQILESSPFGRKVLKRREDRR